MKKNNLFLNLTTQNKLLCSCLLFISAFQIGSAQEVVFGSSGLSGENVNNPTSLDFGPDNKLYVSQQNGIILQYTVERDNAEPGAGSYSVLETNAIDLVQQDIPNHTDDGLVTTVNVRHVTGILTAGTAENPVIYATSSDNLIGGGGSGNDQNLDTNSGMLSKLTFNGSTWDKVDLVRGLPRCEENHSTNGMDIFVKDGITYMLLQQGGHTNMGAPSNNFVGTSEYLLSGSLLIVNLTQLESMPTFIDPRSNTEYVYDLPTINDPEKEDIDNTDENFPYPPSHPLYNATIDLGDPFGGNNSLNQAFAEPGGPVQIFSPGYRNAYDVVVMENGNIYTYDNGPNNNWGGLPVIFDADGSLKGDESNTTYEPENGDFITNEFNENGTYSHGDTLHFVGTIDDENNTYYGGHPVPIVAFPSRANLITYQLIEGSWTETSRFNLEDRLENVSGYFNTEIGIENFPDNPVAAKYLADAIDSDEVNILDIINSSTNGICEYTASNFDNALKGNLFSASFNGNITRYAFNEVGDELTEKETIFNGFGSIPLDIIATPDDHIFPGTIWSVTYGADNITVFEPAEQIVCIEEDSPLFEPEADYDNDGFTNQDEIDNGTNFCSGGSTPADNDGDFISDLNDTDDDNDGILDVNDVFAIDPENGTTTNLPIDYSFFNNDPGTGFFGLGFTGLMLDPSGNTDYLDQFDLDNLSFGGAAGKSSVDVIDDGDAIRNVNSQNNAFQVGINVDSNSSDFTIQSRVESPFFAVDGASTSPVSFQSVGIYMGNGDQDNYVKMVIQNGTSPNLPENGIQVLLEEDGVVQSENNFDVENLLSGNAVDFFISVKPSENTALFYVSNNNGQTVTQIGSEIPLPESFLDATDDQGLAVGIIGTSAGGGDPFSAVWDYFLITEDNPGVLSADRDVIDFGVLSQNDDATQINLQLLNESGPSFGPLEITAINITGNDADLFSADADVPFVVGPGRNYIVPVSTQGNSSIGLKTADLEIVYSDGTTLVIPMTALVNPNFIPIFRINAGGAEIAATDNGPDWLANNTTDEIITEEYSVNTGNIFTGNLDYSNKDNSIPEYIDEDTYNSIFLNERWDSDAGEEMEFNIPMSNGSYLVNLYVANSFGGSDGPGDRIFDISIENEIVEDDLDLIPLFGHQSGGILSYSVDVEDGELNISFGHETENPLVNAIEILIPEVSFEPISISQISNLDSLVNDQIDFAVSVTGGDPSLNYTYAIEGQPDGIAIEPTNGQVFGIINETALDGGIAHNGDHTTTITVSQENGESSSIEFSWDVSPAVSNSLIESYVLYDNENRSDNVELVNGGTYDISDFEFSNLEIVTTETVGSLILDLSGNVDHLQTESFFPYDLFGNNNNNAFSFVAGEYTLTIDIYSEVRGNGIIIESAEISFTLENNAATASQSFLTDETGISIFPNPASEIVAIDVTETGKELAQISISNLFGPVDSFDIANPQQNIFELPVNNYLEGVYFLNLLFSDGTVEIRQLIIE